MKTRPVQHAASGRPGHTSRALWIPLALALAILPLTSRAVAAHTRSVSYSTWEIDPGGAEVALRIQLLELSRLGPDALPEDFPQTRRPGPDAVGPAADTDVWARRLPSELVLISDGIRCVPAAPAHREPDAPGWVRYAWRVECPTDGPRLILRSHVLLDVAPSHLHFARVRFADTSDVLRERVLTESSPDFVLRSSAQDAMQVAGSGLADYVRLGIEHILSGWDHLAFVLGLLLLANRLGDVARLITGFTLAHSLTLALAVLDLVEPRGAAVEAVIAYSVALVAVERCWLSAGRDRRIPAAVVLALGGLACFGATGASVLPFASVLGLILFTACYFALLGRDGSAWLRVCLTFAFGLVHGFGFAGVLLEMALPTDRLVPALLGFNLGVEIGQIAVVVALWPALVLLRRREGLRFSLAGDLVAAGLCGLGTYWLIERAF
ncbi:MAG TPA: HupE/UreJ family protein [Myxococcota bacterium]|nr:HupE/UreJ family protein [Myxococcota bacterium]